MKINITKFDSYQMEEIRRGLEQKLDVSVYADVKFNWQQMQEIRLDLEQKQTSL